MNARSLLPAAAAPTGPVPPAVASTTREGEGQGLLARVVLACERVRRFI